MEEKSQGSSFQLNFAHLRHGYSGGSYAVELNSLKKKVQDYRINFKQQQISALTLVLRDDWKDWEVCYLLLKQKTCKAERSAVWYAGQSLCHAKYGISFTLQKSQIESMYTTPQ